MQDGDRKPSMLPGCWLSECESLPPFLSLKSGVFSDEHPHFLALDVALISPAHQHGLQRDDPMVMPEGRGIGGCPRGKFGIGAPPTRASNLEKRPCPL